MTHKPVLAAGGSGYCSLEHQEFLRPQGHGVPTWGGDNPKVVLSEKAPADVRVSARTTNLHDSEPSLLIERRFFSFLVRHNNPPHEKGTGHERLDQTAAARPGHSASEP
jgi:hypothetical protein